MTPERWARMEELFSAALEQPAALREQWLVSRPDDPAIVSDVRALLRADSLQAEQLISNAISDAARTLRDDAGLAPGEGTRVGPYRLLREIGRGGMGTVYLAERDDQEYQARVAIKFVRGRLAVPDLARRFLAERQILADLNHPCIARLLDGGTADDGTPYLVMEYVDGEPIDVWCNRTGLGLSGRIALFRRVCDAVQHAHARLVVHRDLKPTNMLVGRDGAPKLVDFGIAVLLAGDGDGHATASFQFLTPTYAAPEQARGDRITVATDVYALGGVLYRLLADHPPLDVAGATPADLERRILDVVPPAPSAAATGAAAGWRRRLEGDLDTIVLTALQKDPARRYSSVERLSDDLRRYADGLPVAARPDTFRYRAAKFIRRRRASVASVFLATVVAVGFGVFHTARVTAERDRARIEAGKASEVAAFLQEIFEVSDPSVSRGETVTARELLNAAATRIASRLREQPEVQATLMRVIGLVYASLGLHDEAEPMLSAALEQHRRVRAPGHPEVATSELAYAVWLHEDGQLAEAESLFRMSLASRRQLLGAHDPAVGEAAQGLAYLLQTRGDFTGAEALFLEALAIARASEPPDEARVAAALGRLGRLLRQVDRMDEAEPLLREALTIERRLFGGSDLAVASTARNLAALLRDKGDYEGSDTLFREAIAIRRTILGNDHPEVANALSSYAILLRERGDIDRAIAVTREVLAMSERDHDGPHRDLAAGYSNLGTLLRVNGQLDEAAVEFRKSIGMQDALLTADHPDRAFPRIGLAAVYRLQDRRVEAVALLRDALALRRAGLPAGHRNIAEAAGDLGEVLADLGDSAEAESLLKEAYEILRTGRGADDARTRRAREKLAEFYDAAGRSAEAAQYRAGG